MPESLEFLSFLEILGISFQFLGVQVGIALSFQGGYISVQLFTNSHPSCCQGGHTRRSSAVALSLFLSEGM